MDLGNFFNKPIENLPYSLLYLSLGENFNQNLDFLPPFLLKLTIHNPNYSHDLLNLPKSLKKIIISKRYKGYINIPEGCKLLYSS